MNNEEVNECPELRISCRQIEAAEGIKNQIGTISLAQQVLSHRALVFLSRWRLSRFEIVVAKKVRGLQKKNARFHKHRTPH